MAILKPYIQQNKQLVMDGNNRPVMYDTTPPPPITVTIVGTYPNFSLSPCPGVGDGYWSWRTTQPAYVHEGSDSGCNKGISSAYPLTEIIVGFGGAAGVEYTNGPLQSGDPDYFGVYFPHCAKRSF